MASVSYNAQELPGKIQLSTDGAKISRDWSHRVDMGFRVTVFNLGPGVIPSSIAITGKGTTIVRGHGTQTDDVVHVSIDYQRRPMGDLTPINLRIEYITTSALWKPQYSLVIAHNGRATLNMAAELRSKFHTKSLSLSNMPASFKQSFLESYERQLRQIERQNAIRRRQSLERYPSQLIQKSWGISDPCCGIVTLNRIQLQNVVPTLTGSCQPDVDNLIATLESKHTTTLPAGTLAIFLDGSFIKSTHLPNWNPDEVITVPLGTGPSEWDADAREAADTLVSIWRTAALQPLMNPPSDPVLDADGSHPGPSTSLYIIPATPQEPVCPENSIGSPTEPRTPIASDESIVSNEEFEMVAGVASLFQVSGTSSRFGIEAAIPRPISEAAQGSRRIPHTGTVKGARRSRSPDRRRLRKKARSAQHSNSTKRLRRVSFLASRLWWNPAIWDVAGGGGWKNPTMYDHLAKAEVCLEGDEQPIDLYPCIQGKTWEGYYSGKGKLVVQHQEIVRLARAGTEKGEGMIEV